MKRCVDCNKTKPAEQFRKHSKRCRGCFNIRQNELRKKDLKRHQASAKARWKTNKRSRADFLFNEKQAPCTDCKGHFHPVAMDFDHVRGVKLNEVSTLLRTGASLERLKAEVAKCELVCANCHRVRTHNRKGPPADRPYSIY